LSIHNIYNLLLYIIKQSALVVNKEYFTKNNLKNLLKRFIVEAVERRYFHAGIFEASLFDSFDYIKHNILCFILENCHKAQYIGFGNSANRENTCFLKACLCGCSQLGGQFDQ
jgi:hypothetical protein